MEIFLICWICDFLEENPLEKLFFLFCFSSACGMLGGETHPLGSFFSSLLSPFHIVMTFLVFFWQSTSGCGFLSYLKLKEQSNSQYLKYTGERASGSRSHQHGSVFSVWIETRVGFFMSVYFFIFLAEGVLQNWEINPGLVITVSVCVMQTQLLLENCNEPPAVSDSLCKAKQAMARFRMKWKKGN